jgi:hypothetical protein
MSLYGENALFGMQAAQFSFRGAWSGRMRGAAVYQDGASCEVDALHHLPRQHDWLVPPVVEALVPIPARMCRFPSLNPISKLRGA